MNIKQDQIRLVETKQRKGKAKNFKQINDPSLKSNKKPYKAKNGLEKPRKAKKDRASSRMVTRAKTT